MGTYDIQFYSSQLFSWHVRAPKQYEKQTPILRKIPMS
jgi:hypothetical protein